MHPKRAFSEAPATACPSWPPPKYTPRGYLLVLAYGGVNQQTSQVSDALVLGHALRAHVILPERLVHHFWNDSLRVPELLDMPHWRASAALINVPTVAPEELTGDVAAWYAQCGRKGDLPDSGKTTPACAKFHVGLPKGGTVASARDAILPSLRRYGVASVNTLKRMHEPNPDPMQRMLDSMLFVSDRDRCGRSSNHATAILSAGPAHKPTPRLLVLLLMASCMRRGFSSSFRRLAC